MYAETFYGRPFTPLTPHIYIVQLGFKGVFSILVERLCETRIIRILILVIIIRAGTPSTSTGNHNVLIPKFNIFWIPAKVVGTTEERGTSADYYYL